MKQRHLKTLFAAVSLTAAASFGISSAEAATAWVGDFETGNLSQYSTNELPKSDSGVITSSPRREGAKALKILLREGDAPGRNRAEVMPKAWSSYPSFEINYQIGQEYWYAFSTYLPSNWVIDNDKEILFQFHSSPDRDLGEEFCRNPPLALYVDGDKWGLRNRADGRRILPCGVAKQFEQYWTLGAIKRGGWTDWVFRVKWSYGSDGILQVWRDGQLVLSRTGMNTYNDARGPYLKLGLYKFTWNSRTTLTNRRELYLDGVKVEKGPSTLQAMSPSGASVPSIPEGDTGSGTTEGVVGGDTSSSPTGPAEENTGDSTAGETADTSPTVVTDGDMTGGDTGGGSPAEEATGGNTIVENTDVSPAAAAEGGGGGAEGPFYLYLLAMLVLARSRIFRKEAA